MPAGKDFMGMTVTENDWEILELPWEFPWEFP